MILGCIKKGDDAREIVTWLVTEFTKITQKISSIDTKSDLSTRLNNNERDDTKTFACFFFVPVTNTTWDAAWLRFSQKAREGERKGGRKRGRGFEGPNGRFTIVTRELFNGREKCV